jgi:dTDP-glucose 4,6-dehydratase
MLFTNIIYITGCLGFIGYHTTKKILDEGHKVIGVDKRTYASHDIFLDDLLTYKNFKFLQKDINELDSLYECDYVINIAAESHVDNSIINSNVFLMSNVNGVHHLLNLIKDKHRHKMPIFLHFSTDEVYGDIEVGSHTETDLLKPSNPYSATKAAADMLILAWNRTFNVPYIIVRPTNNYGIGQYTEKLIPKTCKYLTLGKQIPLHQNGKPKRTWLNVKDTANAILKIIESNEINQIYNISGNYEDSNLNVVKKIINQYYNDINYDKFIDFSYHRPGQDIRYSIDDSKLKSLGWKPQTIFDNELPEIVEFYKNNFIW